MVSAYTFSMPVGPVVHSVLLSGRLSGLWVQSPWLLIVEMVKPGLQTDLLGGGGGLEGARKKEGPQLRQQHLGLKAENKESLKKEVRRGSSRPRGTHRRLRASEKFQKLFLISPGLRLEREPQGEHTLRGAHLGRRGAEP